jgi:hypothetical protein
MARRFNLRLIAVMHLPDSGDRLFAVAELHLGNKDN